MNLSNYRLFSSPLPTGRSSQSALRAKVAQPPSRASRVVKGALAAAALLFSGFAASAQVVSHDFEDGTTQGWGPRGDAVPSHSTEEAHTGLGSLKTTGRSATWQGPSLNLLPLLAPDTTYRITGWVRLVDGHLPSNLKFSIQKSLAGGGDSFAQVNNPETVTDGAWVQLQGDFSFTETDNTGMVIYLESDDAFSEYFLDDFTIEALSGSGCPEPPDQSGLFTDFESGATEGWFGRGPAAVANTGAIGFESSRSLSVTGRTASWNGPAIDALCKLHKGSKYLISVWVRLHPGETPIDMRLSLQAGLAGSTSFHTVVGNTNVTDGEWVNLSTEYTFALDADQLQLYVETASGTASFYIDEFLVAHIPSQPIQTDIPSLKDVLADYFPIGTAIEPPETIGLHAELLLKHFDQFTAGNAMKWSSLQPTEGNFNFGPADTLANFARDNGLRMYGHTLLWHSQVPDWVFQDAAGNPLEQGNAADRALLIDRLETHIKTIVPRYLDIVDDWDVVNEVIDANEPDGLRRSLWYSIIGPEYIDLAFQFASEVAGDTGLYINDYNTHQPAKRDALKNVVQGLLDRGIPVDGVGHQMHINVEQPPLQQIRDTIETFGDMGLDNKITEMDVSAYTNSTDTAPVSEETLVEQGYRYRDIFDLYRELSDIISSVTLWGLADDNTWLKTFPIARDDKPLLFDEDLQAKHAYWGVVDPTRLPLVPKEARAPMGQVRVNGSDERIWDALAPIHLMSEGDDASWADFKSVWKDDTLYLLVQADTADTKGLQVDVFVENEVFPFQGLGRQRPNGADGLATSRNGYRLEAAIPLGLPLIVGDEIAFDIRVTETSGEMRQVSWSDVRHNQDNDTSNLGTLQLIAEKKIAQAGLGAVVIDGIIDPRWNAAASIHTNTFVLGDSGATAEVRLLWDHEYLQVLAVVSDPLLSKASPNPWEQDSIEIFIDQNNAQTAAYQSDDAQYRVNFDNEQSFGGAASADAFTSATRIVNGGYVVEASIRLDDALLSANGYIGFDIQVNDDGAGDGIRTSVATWNDTTGNAFQDPSQFGALHLIQGKGRK